MLKYSCPWPVKVMGIMMIYRDAPSGETPEAFFIYTVSVLEVDSPPPETVTVTREPS